MAHPNETEAEAIKRFAAELSQQNEAIFGELQALYEVQQIVFIGLVDSSPKMKARLGSLVRHALDHAEEYPLQDRTVQMLKTLEQYAKNHAPTAKGRPRLTLVPPSAPPTSGPVD